MTPSCSFWMQEKSAIALQDGYAYKLQKTCIDMQKTSKFFCTILANFIFATFLQSRHFLQSGPAILIFSAIGSCNFRVNSPLWIHAYYCVIMISYQVASLMEQHMQKRPQKQNVWAFLPSKVIKNSVPPQKKCGNWKYSNKVFSNHRMSEDGSFYTWIYAAPPIGIKKSSLAHTGNAFVKQFLCSQHPEKALWKKIRIIFFRNSA